MIGVLLLSHSKMSEGMLKSLELFFGENIPQIASCCLEGSDAPETFDEKIDDALKKVDDGHGVLVFADLLGGTPCNRCMFKLNDRFQVISGMNLTMLIEFMTIRSCNDEMDVQDVDIDALIEVGRQGIISLNKKVKDLKNA